MIEELKRKDFQKYQFSINSSSSSNLMPSQKPYENSQKRKIPLGNSASARVSIFGADISNSPSSCSKGNGSKDCEIVECRPSKVRKKLFDLERPPNEYIDPEEGEQSVDTRASEISSYPLKETFFAPKNGVKTFLDDGWKRDGYKDNASGQRVTSSNGLIDLNEPVYSQEASVDFLRQAARPVAVNQLPSEVNGRDRFSSSLRESGSSRSNMNYTPQCFQPSKLQTPPDTMKRLNGKDRGNYPEISSQINQTPWLYGTSSGYPFINNTSDMGNSWSPSASGSSWGKPNDGMSRKLNALQTHPSFLSSPRNHEVFGEKWHRNGYYGKNTGSGADVLVCSRFYQGSSSGSKELPARFPSGGFDYRNCKKIDDGSQKIFKGSNFVDLTGSTRGMDLNTVQTLSDEDDDSSKREQKVLPWLTANATPVSKNKSAFNDMFKNSDRAKEKDDTSGNHRRLSGVNECISKPVVSTSASKEHRGFDINVAWEDAMDSEHIDVETCKREETDRDIKNFKNNFDLNSCVTEEDDLLVTEYVKTSTLEIDLEAPADSKIEEQDETRPKSDHEELLTKIASKAIVAISGQQDYPGSKSPAAIDDHDDHDHDDHDQEQDLDSLQWFAGVIDSCEKSLISVTHEIDEYEMLALQAEETKEEDYMPTQFVSEFQEPDEAGPSLTNRPRRGQARRGRPRRDFQRDILPGMISLSRHEITEDLQIFGGLMRATGHAWNSGLTRRNGKKVGGRGRPKLKGVEPTPAVTVTVPPSPPPLSSNNAEVVGLDERSLTGWGKTTRRPRRQRCASGNSAAVHIT